MNKEHMEAGLEGKKRQDFTINNIKGWRLMGSRFGSLEDPEVQWE